MYCVCIHIPSYFVRHSRARAPRPRLWAGHTLRSAGVTHASPRRRAHRGSGVCGKRTHESGAVSIHIRSAAAARGNHGAGGRGARRTNRMYSRSDGTLYTSTPLGNLSLASAVESSGSTCTHTGCVVVCIWATRSLVTEVQVGMYTVIAMYLKAVHMITPCTCRRASSWQGWQGCATP